MYFPVIAVQSHPHPYLMAILPKDHDLDTLEPSDIQGASRSEMNSRIEDTEQNKSEATDTDIIDNPYLQPVKMPRYKKFKNS